MNKNILWTGRTISPSVNDLIDKINELEKRLLSLETALHENNIHWDFCSWCGYPVTKLFVIPFRQCLHAASGSSGVKVIISGKDVYCCWKCLPKLIDLDTDSQDDNNRIMWTIAYWVKRHGQYKLFEMRNLPDVQSLLNRDDLIKIEMQMAI